MRTEDVRKPSLFRKELVPWLIVPFAVVILILIVAGFAFQNAIQLNARRAILDDLNGLTGSYVVTVDGRTVDDGANLVPLLKGVHLVPAHHSQPTHPIRIRITERNNVVDLFLARDSERGDEYWVFGAPPDNQRSIGQNAGRIVDRRLTSYLQKWGL